MESLHWMLLLIVTGFLLLGFGFNFRDHMVGVCLMAMGIVVTLSTVLLKLYTVLY
ncbi:hypothetical protein [Pseudomonas flexibilis]|uniref:hypothetical protein n=1 Tax=Pseudomonas flexibilis TaxID=706570 RepID=UPI0008764499|nr:hypothetical protein [Pseudomonas flexibilis]SCX88346.1 hypothetical protein SAMN02927929_00826 [Pseudomonas flexibilis]